MYGVRAPRGGFVLVMMLRGCASSVAASLMRSDSAKKERICGRPECCVLEADVSGCAQLARLSVDFVATRGSDETRGAPRLVPMRC